MAPYLPRNGASGSPYSEGGALYALGLTYANHGHDVKDFLLQSLRETASEALLLSSLCTWHEGLIHQKYCAVPLSMSGKWLLFLGLGCKSIWVKDGTMGHR